MPTAREAHVAGVVDGILYVTGGIGSEFPITVDAYNPQTDTWVTKGLMSTPRAGAAVGVINGVLYVVGGSTGTRTQLESYNPNSNSWTTETAMPTGRSGLAVGVVDDILYAVGGQTRFGDFAVNEAFSPFLHVGIDIKPGDPKNTLSYKAAGTVAVAILGSATFDPLTVDPTTVTLAGARPVALGPGQPQSLARDVNRDGYFDLILHFRIRDLQLTLTDTQAVLYGTTYSGQRIRGADAVRLLPFQPPATEARNPSLTTETRSTRGPRPLLPRPR
jgi:hypothetical protein